MNYFPWKGGFLQRRQLECKGQVLQSHIALFPSWKCDIVRLALMRWSADSDQPLSIVVVQEDASDRSSAVAQQ
jgi:hypothetical protein